MVFRKKKRVKKKTAKRFRFQLSLAEIAGIAIVSFCLFLWMFLLGIWAGQTILLPSSDTGISPVAGRHASLPFDHKTTTQVIQPQGKKRAVTR
jgi:hypothetical protein